MGKSKKTRWRTFEISGSQDETQTNGADVKVNGTDLDKQTPVTTQKYSQILGDHHSNNSTNQFSRNSSSNNIYKTRGYNNKENLYNQRAVGRPGVQRSWQRGGNYRTSFASERDKKPTENGSNEAKVDSTAEPIKFNEDEYTRITTPRQDVLFKKGYLSRMNNKTASNLSATVNSADSTAASSTITTSDPDSSVSTLSPATTPSMDYGQLDSMEYPPMYYPGYYDENGLLVIPMYNGYNYYPPNGSNATSPVYLMPYNPYQYDPFFMTPSGLQPVDGEENVEDKTESDGAKENNHQAENQNGARTTSSSSEDGATSTHDDEIKDETITNENKENGTENADDGKESVEVEDADQKQSFPIYPNELNGYMYPVYPNGYYNNYYYYNGAPASRPPKMRRRKRFLNSRNSQHNQHPRSAETTTDYSDEDNTTYQKRFTPRYQNGWHYNGYNHYNGKFHRFHVDQNANQTPNEFHLNVDVQEFYPRVHPSSNESDTNVNCNPQAAAADLERTRTSPSPKPKVEAAKATKTSHTLKPSTGRVSKKELIEGIKSMEQQNIDLMATKHQTTKTANQDVEWNVIKNGKKVKVVKDIKMELSSSDLSQDKIEEAKIEEPKMEFTPVPEVIKKSAPAPVKPKKAKNKGGKKKKSHLMGKQDGFEIIEPEFNNPQSNGTELDEMTQELSEEDTVAQSPADEVEVVENLVLNDVETTEESVAIVEQEISARKVESTLQAPESCKENTPEVNDLRVIINNVSNEDAVIDISDEDICRKVDDISFAISSFSEVEPVVGEIKQKEVQEKPEVQEKLEVQDKPEVQKKLEVDEKPQVQLKLNVNCKPAAKTTVDSKAEVEPKLEAQDPEPETKTELFQDSDFFSDRTNIAALERDLMENLRLLDDDFDLKSPIINPLHDFPITSAVRKWLQAKNTESFDNLFHVQNFKKLSELYDDADEDDDETDSNISEKEMKSETDSDYASDNHAKANGDSPSCSTHAKGSAEKSSKCNKLIAKESFCALM